MKKSPDQTRDPDRLLWFRAEGAFRRRRRENSRPSPEELASFLDQTADEETQKKLFRWLASEEGAVEELRVLRQPLPPADRLDPSHLKIAESRIRSLVGATLKRDEKARSRPLRDFILDLLYARNWAAVAFAACVLIATGTFAFHLGTATFQNRRQAESIVMNELTFGLSGTLPPPSPASPPYSKEERKP